MDMWACSAQDNKIWPGNLPDRFVQEAETTSGYLNAGPVMVSTWVATIKMMCGVNLDNSGTRLSGRSSATQPILAQQTLRERFIEQHWIMSLNIKLSRWIDTLLMTRPVYKSKDSMSPYGDCLF
jgi:hypothetical protein